MHKNVSHRKIADDLRGRIRTGALKLGDRLPSFGQLNRQFGASPSTVRKALDLLSVDGLIDRRRRSGTYVALEVSKVRQVRLGLMGTRQMPRSDYWVHLLAGIQEAALQRKADMLLAHDVDCADWSEYDGLLLFGDSLKVMRSKPAALPAVALESSIVGVSSVRRNEYQAGFVATEHLKSLGHERVGFLGQFGSPSGILRASGIRAALTPALGNDASPGYDRFFWAMRHVTAASNFEVARPNTYVPNDYPAVVADAAERNMDIWIDEGFRELDCTALIVQNDFHAMGVIRSLQRHGYSIPEDISIIGFDNERAGADFCPALTSMAADMSRIGAVAVGTLMRLISGEEVEHTEVLVPVRLVVRGSTAVRPGMSSNEFQRPAVTDNRH